MAALDRIMCAAIAVMEFVISQGGVEVDASWHAPVLQQHAATRYNSLNCHLGKVAQEFGGLAVRAVLLGHA